MGSIHGILAALLGSTALGGFAPLTLTSAIQISLIGQRNSSIYVNASVLHALNAIRPNQTAAMNHVRHTMIGPRGMMPNAISFHHVLAMKGIMPNALTRHTMITSDMSGYGYNYGESYGD